VDVPNVLVLCSDEHNPRYASPYGHPFVRTPNMERLAEMGTLFESAYCPSPLCMPSRSAYQAGRYVHEIQTYSNSNAIEHHYPSLGAALAGQDVHTVHMGKMDVYTETANLGYSEYHHTMDRPPPGDTNIARDPLCIRKGAHRRAKGYGPHEDAGTGDAFVVGEGIRWLEETAPGLHQPWMLAVNINAPHFPHVVPPDLWEAYAGHEDLPDHGMEAESASHPHAVDLRAHFETNDFAEADVRGLRRGYYGAITFVDRQLGRLLDALEASGRQDDTLVVYTSDHGEMLGTFGMWWKCSLYEDSARVPLIVAGPGFGCGERVKTPVTTLDLQASLFRALGRDRPGFWRGEPLQDVAKLDPSRVAFAEYHGHGVRHSSYMIRRGRWKYLHHTYEGGPHQLFDLERDPMELDNLIDTKPSIAADLQRHLRAICDPEAEDQRAAEFVRRQLAVM
jgi:choline-sulfatase